ncbi:MAG: hypothetical protein LBN02_06875 [Oscillospiraceae bacterium]|jgi:hypothetical protein|nr:hypothetical protein [Oscillospiraceae bacterium]
MQTVTLILSDALFLVLMLLFVALDRRVSRVEALRRRSFEQTVQRVRGAEESLAALHEEIARILDTNRAPESPANTFDAGLAEILGYGVGLGGEKPRDEVEK